MAAKFHHDKKVTHCNDSQPLCVVRWSAILCVFVRKEPANNHLERAEMNIRDLRPTFFRFGAGTVYSGWMTTSGDYWTTTDVLAELVESLRDSGHKAVALENALQAPNELGLLLVKHAAPALEIGEHLEFSRDVDIHPLTYVERGERCVVGRRCKTSGSVELFMTNYHSHLDDYSNCITVEPHNSDDVVSALRLCVDEMRGLRTRLVAVA